MVQYGLLFRALPHFEVNTEVILSSCTINFSELLELFSQQPPTLCNVYIRIRPLSQTVQIISAYNKYYYWQVIYSFIRLNWVPDRAPHCDEPKVL